MAATLAKKPKSKKKKKSAVPKAKGVRGMKLGKGTGIGFFEWMANALERNESVPVGKKLSDEKLSSAIKSEFRGNPEILKCLDNGTYSVSYYRSMFNRDVLLVHRNSDVVSFEYNKTGKPINHRTGKEMSGEDQKAYKSMYKGLRERNRKKKLSKLKKKS